MASYSPPQSAAPNEEDFWDSIPHQLRLAVCRVIPADEVSEMAEQCDGTDSVIDKYQAFEKILQHTLDVRSTSLGPEHIDTLAVLFPLAMVQTELGHNVLAELNYLKLLEVHERLNGPDSSWAVMNNLALVLNAQGKYSEAEEILRRLIPLLNARMGAESPQVLGCWRKLIEALAAQGKQAEAREMLFEGLKRTKNMTGEYQKDEQKAMQEMAAYIDNGSQQGSIAAH